MTAGFMSVGITIGRAEETEISNSGDDRPARRLVLYLFVPGVRERPWTAWRLGGVAVAAAGCILFVTARFQLGNSFSVSPQAKGLVTYGIIGILQGAGIPHHRAADQSRGTITVPLRCNACLRSKT